LINELSIRSITIAIYRETVKRFTRAKFMFYEPRDSFTGIALQSHNLKPASPKGRREYYPQN
jgi:hypothetical protein